MPEPGTSNRSLIWRMLPWLVPLALILVGLVFVAAGVTDRGGGPGPERDAAPATVTARFAADAPAWAASQVGPGITTEVVDVLMVGADATGSSTFSARAVIIRHDAVTQVPTAAGEPAPALAATDTSTVATCVLWNVDVTNQTSTPLAAVEIVREVGLHDLDDPSGLRERCRNEIVN